jgi:hypothetical protein
MHSPRTRPIPRDGSPIEAETSLVTPEAAVARLAEIIATRSHPSEDDVYSAMAAAGVPDADADRAYKFTQIAWGRVFLDGLGVRFSPEYFCFDGAGEVVESGMLSEQPFYAAAMAAAPGAARSAGFGPFALTSSEATAVNAALNAGSSPENLEAGPPALFLEAPTADGLEKARRHLTERATTAAAGLAAAAPAESDGKRPWWRVW